MTTPVTFKILVWIKAKKDIEPFYRIFIDGELFTERSFIWDADSTHIRENIAANLGPGKHLAEVRFCNISADQIESTKCQVFLPQIDPIPMDAKFNAGNCDYAFPFTLN